MEQKKLRVLIQQIIEGVEKKIPEYKSSPDDWNISQGNVGLCIIDDQGNIYGKMFGPDKIRQRGFFEMAEKKATQVYITRINTGEFEELAYAKKIDWFKYGIMKPDYVGWEGGQLIQLDEETQISVGFSGFMGENDLALVADVAAEIIK
ncbi:MAG: hypothetical protein PF447_10890 [Spirochaetaceae bacterium]|jgi:uncharacterized protein GlcG (DUF336 family)|nr:hypothetical protein [Spirochaetaceae bacterium]